MTETEDDVLECNQCHKTEIRYFLYEHEASGEKHLCQDCLAKFLKAGIEEDGKDEWRGYIFKEFKFGIQAVNDEVSLYGSDTSEALEQVLMKLKLI